MREPQSCLGPAFARATYRFFATGTSTPANVYEDGALTTPFPITGYVTADNFGRFPPIYLDPSIIYKVQLYDNTNTLRYTVDPYVPPLSTVGTSANVPYGINIAATGEVTIPSPNSGGTGISLTLNAGALGSAPLKVSAPVAGNSAIIINNSATTGAHTATFTATNKPGTATSSPAGWLPITCDNVQYYIPIWHGNNFTPYTAQPGVLGETIVGNNAGFNGDGSTTVLSGSANPSSWYQPATAGIGASYYISVTKTGGLSGQSFICGYDTTAAPSGATYTGGTLTTSFAGASSSTYTLQTSLGQLITGCTFTNGSTTFSCPSTSINGSPTVFIAVGIPAAKPQNISATGIAIGTNSAQAINGTSTISNNITGTPVLASGTMTLQAIGGAAFGPSAANWNVTAPIVFADNGTTTAAGASVEAWSEQNPLAGQGANYWILITQTSGTPGYAFNAATAAWQNISSGGLTVGISGPPGTNFFVAGTYQIALDSAGAYVVATGSITLNGGTNVQSPNWNGTPALALASNGTATLNGVGTSAWYSPTTAGVGASYWFNITRTGGTSGVNFTNAQGSWVNIGSGLSVNISGYTGDVGSVSAVGTWKISNSNTGSPVLGTGTITLTVSGLTVIHIYTSGSGTETIPTGTNNTAAEAWGGGAGGGGGDSGVRPPTVGGGGGGGAYVRSTFGAGNAGKTLAYAIGGAGSGGGAQTAGGNGGATTISSGTLSITTMQCAAASGGGGGTSGGSGSGGAGGIASGGTAANTNGNPGSGSTGGAGIVGTVSGDGSPYGAGGTGGTIGSGGRSGAVVFYYT